MLLGLPVGLSLELKHGLLISAHGHFLFCGHCNSRLLKSHMRLRKKRAYSHWLKGQGHYLLCFCYLIQSEPIRFTCDMRLQTVLQLKGYYQNTPTLEIKTPHGQVSKYLKHANALKNRVGSLSIPLVLLDSGTSISDGST